MPPQGSCDSRVLRVESSQLLKSFQIPQTIGWFWLASTGCGVAVIESLPGGGWWSFPFVCFAVQSWGNGVYCNPNPSRGAMFETGKRIILDVLDRRGYSLCRKEDLKRRIDEEIRHALSDQYFFRHAMPRGYPPAPYAFTREMEPTGDDRAIARRFPYWLREGYTEELCRIVG
jgi:hypothetical protein